MFNQEIEPQLQELGLKGSKAKVYLSLIQLGKGTAASIARRAGLKRTTVYDALEFLIQKSLAARECEEKRKQYVACPPKNLRDLVFEKEEIVKNVIPQLSAIMASTPSKPTMKYFHGHQGIRDVAWDMIITCESKKAYYWGDMFDYFRVLKEEKMFNQRFVQERVKRGIWSYGIWKYDPRVLTFYTPERNRQELREVRFAPKEIEIDVYIQLYDDKVGIISTKGDGYGILLESRDLNRTLKSFFDFMWSVCRQYKSLSVSDASRRGD